MFSSVAKNAQFEIRAPESTADMEGAKLAKETSQFADARETILEKDANSVRLWLTILKVTKFQERTTASWESILEATLILRATASTASKFNN